MARRCILSMVGGVDGDTRGAGGALDQPQPAARAQASDTERRAIIARRRQAGCLANQSTIFGMSRSKPPGM
jgi:hypothetical protein